MAAIFTDSELREFTETFQTGDYSPNRPLEILAAFTRSMVTEPGDRMAGALARVLGPIGFLEALSKGFPVEDIISKLSFEELCELEGLFGDLRATLEDSRQRWLPRLKRQNLVLALSRTRHLGLKLVFPGHELFPQSLFDLQDSAPALLFVEGDTEVLRLLANSISIVGSRRASSYGLAVTRALVEDFAKTGRVTVSGGAVGIDAEAHAASLRNGTPTIAVMAGGLDRRYPRANFPLFDQISNTGAILSELAPGVAPSRWRFLQRNRIIAALTPKTIVVEAGIRSGSIRTANDALELDRKLYAVPGSILSPSSAGTNELIASGKAEMLRSANELSEESVRPIQQTESDLAKRALDALVDLGTAPQATIAENAGLTRSELLIALSELSRDQKIIEVPIGYGSSHYALNHGERTGISQ